jgi:pimeloyl-ACP methyl ester carboxylesterase
MDPILERRFVRVPAGVVHCASAGEGDAVLLLHQTPRSWDEYRDVIPILARRRHVVAMDTIGFGDSTRLPPGEDSIERWADVAVSLLEALGIEQAAVVGHHTGGYIAGEIGVARPECVTAVVLSSVTVHPPEERLAHASGRAVVDDVVRSADGSHLVELWRLRASFYPPGTDLLERYIVDCIKAGDLAAEGHRVVARYAAEQRFPLLSCPVLLIGATEDPHAYPWLDGVHEAIPHASVAVIEGGTVPLPDQLPGQFVGAVEEFLDRLA